MKRSILALVALALWGCRDLDTIYRDFRPIGREEWCVNDVQTFDVRIPEADTYALYLAVRHTVDYEMANLWCFVQVADSAGTTLYRDTVNMKLAEADGRWIGRGNAIKTFQQADHPANIPLPPGRCSVRIEQGMRIRCLKGIKDIGIHLRRNTPPR